MSFERSVVEGVKGAERKVILINGCHIIVMWKRQKSRHSSVLARFLLYSKGKGKSYGCRWISFHTAELELFRLFIHKLFIACSYSFSMKSSVDESE